VAHHTPQGIHTSGDAIHVGWLCSWLVAITAGRFLQVPFFADGLTEREPQRGTWCQLLITPVKRLWTVTISDEARAASCGEL